MTKISAEEILRNLGFTPEEIYTQAENNDTEITDERLYRIATFLFDDPDFSEARHNAVGSAIQFTDNK